MTPLTRTAGTLLVAACAMAMPRRAAAQLDLPIPPGHHGIYVTNATMQCAWITITYSNDKNKMQAFEQYKGGLAGDRRITGPLWVAAHKSYKFVVLEAYRMKVRAEVQKLDCAAYHGKWDTGSIAGGNVYDTVGEIPGITKRNKTGVTLKYGNQNYYLEFDTSK